MDPPTIYDVYVNVNEGGLPRMLRFGSRGGARPPPRRSSANFHRRQGSIAHSLPPCFRAARIIGAFPRGHTSMIAPLALIRRVCAAVFFAALCCHAQAAPPPGVSQGPSVDGITEYGLGNGLKVLLFP